MRILLPPENMIRAIQHRERAYYWSGCAEGVLRKHGFVDVAGAPSSRPDDLIVVTRQTVNPHADHDRPAVYEGPLSPETLEHFGVRSAPCAAEQMVLLNESKEEVIGLSRPVVRVRSIPRQAGQPLGSPYVYVCPDRFWHTRLIRFDELRAGGRWAPAAYVKLRPTGREKVVALTAFADCPFSVVSGHPIKMLGNYSTQ